MQCPYCAEFVGDDLLRCPECGESLEHHGPNARRTTSPCVALFISMVLVVLFFMCFFLWLVSMGAVGDGEDTEANERASVAVLISLSAAQRTLTQQKGGNGVASTLAELARGGLIDAQLASGTREGYRFALSKLGKDGAWRGVASPQDEFADNRYFAVSADGVVWASDTEPTLDPRVPLPARSVPVASLDPPAVPDESVFRPGFVLSDGEHTRAGIAFVVEFSGREPVILTALHLLGEAGGFSRELPPNRVAAEVSRLDLGDVFSSAGIASVTSAGIGILGSAPLGEPSKSGDVVAFWAPPGMNVGSFSCSSSIPPAGAEVWLVSEVSSGAPEGRLLHRAVVDFYDEDERLLNYDFDDPIELRATSGGAVIDAAGRVVGVHLGGGASGGVVYGVANPVHAFRSSLFRALDRHPLPPQPTPFAGQEFDQARRSFASQLVERPAPQGYEDETPPEGATVVRYPSGNHSLMAWVSTDPGDGAKRPGVVFLHGGFSFAEQDWTDTATLREAGFVVMTPTLRGENGNPGSFECFYGEVDDAVAAGRYLASLPYVDPKALFVCGHSVGGTLTTLTCMVPSPFRAGISLSGSQDVERWIASQLGIAPFPITSPQELAIRNPSRFVSSVRLPMRFYVEDDGGRHSADIRTFVDRAKQAGRSVELFELSNVEHWDMVQPALQHAVPYLQELAKQLR